MAGVGDAVVHDLAVAVDVGHADDRNPPRGLRRHCPLLRARRKRPCGQSAAEQRDEVAWQEEMQRAAQKSLAVMCPACPLSFWSEPSGSSLVLRYSDA